MENAFSKAIAFFLLHCAFAILVLCGASTVDASARLQKKGNKTDFSAMFPCVLALIFGTRVANFTSLQQVCFVQLP